MGSPATTYKFDALFLIEYANLVKSMNNKCYDNKIEKSCVSSSIEYIMRTIGKQKCDLLYPGCMKNEIPPFEKN